MLPRRPLLLALPALLLAPRARAASFDRPIRLVVPYAPGGNVDVVARLLAPGMGARLGQPVVVENRTGAGGTLGAETVVRARPDGHVLLAGSNGPLAVNQVLQARMPFEPLRDLAPIAMASRVPLAMVARKALAAADLAALVALSRASASGLNWASSGTGTSPHLALERLKAATGAKLVHVPYRGGGTVAADVIAGVVDGVMLEFNTALPLHKDGAARILAITADARSPLLPEVPIVADTVPGFSAYSFVGLLAPTGTPADVVLALREAMVAALAEPALRERITGTGGEIAAAADQTPEGFATFIRGEQQRARAAAELAGIKPE